MSAFKYGDIVYISGQFWNGTSQLQNWRTFWELTMYMTILGN